MQARVLLSKKRTLLDLDADDDEEHHDDASLLDSQTESHASDQTGTTHGDVGSGLGGNAQRSVGFRVNSKSCLVTWAAVGSTFDKPQLAAFLESKHQVLGGAASREVHPTTGIDHYHAVVVAATKFNIRDCRFFDFKGIHPNIKSMPVGPAIKYISKEDKEPLVFGDFNLRAHKMGLKGADIDFEEAMRKSTAEEAIEYLETHRPRDMLVNGGRIRAAIFARLPTTVSHAPVSVANPKPFRITALDDVFAAWMEQCRPGVDRSPVFILLGRTQLGKSQWVNAKLPGLAQWQRGTLDWAGWGPKDAYMYEVYDDIDKWDIWGGPLKDILLAKHSTKVNPKSLGIAYIPCNRFSIVIANSLENIPWFEKEQGFWEENSVVYTVTEPLWED